MANIRSANANDVEEIWGILEPVFRARETCTLPRDINRAEALAYWFATAKRMRQERYTRGSSALSPLFVIEE